MARISSIGYEVDVPGNAATKPDNPNGGATSGTLTRATTHQRSGSGCLACASGAGNAAAYQALITPAISTTYFIRAYMNFDALPASTVRVLGCLSTSGVSARLTSGGKLQLWNNTTPAQIGSDSSATVSAGTDTYYRIELNVVINGSTQVASGELLLDGVSVATFSGLTLANGAIVAGWGDAPGATKTVYVDDVAINTSAGTVNNSWPGDGKVVMLLPTSDSAVGTGWVLGGNGAEGGAGWDSINNVPPQGVADLVGTGADTKQIRNATAAANSNFDANLTTYTAAGIGTGDTINALHPWVMVAAPSATSPKSGSIGVPSNPTIAQLTFGGSFYAGAPAGTYPTGWGGWPGTVAEAPSVTLGTAPVIRVTQITSSTRIAVVCFLGMYVDYTPTVVAKAPPPPARNVNRVRHLLNR